MNFWLFQRFLFHNIVITLSNKFTPISLYKDEQNDQWKNVGNITSRPSRELDSASCICFLLELIPAPSIAACTEQKVDQASDRKQVITYNKVLEILNIASCSQRHEAAPYVESKNTWKGKYNDRDQISHNRLCS